MQRRRQDWNYRTPNSWHIFRSWKNNIKTDPEYTERECRDCITRDQDKDQWRIHQNQDKDQCRTHLSQVTDECRIYLNQCKYQCRIRLDQVRISGGFICIRTEINDGFIWIRIRSVADSPELGNKPLVADSWVHGTQTAGTIKWGDFKYMASNNIFRKDSAKLSQLSVYSSLFRIQKSN